MSYYVVYVDLATGKIRQAAKVAYPEDLFNQSDLSGCTRIVVLDQEEGERIMREQENYSLDFENRKLAYSRREG